MVVFLREQTVIPVFVHANEYISNLSAGYRYVYNIQVASMFVRVKLQFIYEYSIQKLDFACSFLENMTLLICDWNKDKRKYATVM